MPTVIGLIILIAALVLGLRATAFAARAVFAILGFIGLMIILVPLLFLSS